MSSPGTRPTQVRLTAQELERVERLKARFAIRTTSDVIRVALAALEDSTVKTRQPKKIPE
jgi:Arc/MetJ-type ribon-helix-helix transcriptional regulator